MKCACTVTLCIVHHSHALLLCASLHFVFVHYIALSTITLFFDNFYLLQCNIIFHCNKVQALHYLHKTYKRSPRVKEQSAEGMMAEGASVEGVMVEDNGHYTKELNPYVVNTI